jgi:hypothetical protein
VLVVAAGPLQHGLPKIVELNATVIGAGPQVDEFVAQLGMPDKRWQIVDGDGHSDVVHWGVCQRLDGAVGSRAASEQPQVAGPGLFERLVEGQHRG